MDTHLLSNPQKSWTVYVPGRPENMDGKHGQSIVVTDPTAGPIMDTHLC